MSSPSPGWYTDPDDPAQLRYWNGRSWTESRSLAAEVPLAAPAGVPAQEAPVAPAVVPQPAPVPAWILTQRNIYEEAVDLDQVLTPDERKAYGQHTLNRFPTWLVVVLHFLTLGIFTFIYQGVEALEATPRAQQRLRSRQRDRLQLHTVLQLLLELPVRERDQRPAQLPTPPSRRSQTISKRARHRVQRPLGYPPLRVCRHVDRLDADHERVHAVRDEPAPRPAGARSRDCDRPSSAELNRSSTRPTASQGVPLQVLVSRLDSAAVGEKRRTQPPVMEPAVEI